MDSSTAQNITNYTFDQSLAVSAAVLQPDNKTVQLTVSPVVAGIT
jgi:hypothetical protein